MGAAPKFAPADVEQWDEAVKWFLARVPMTKDRWLKLTAAARRKAFTVAGVAKADVLHDVHRAVDSAIAKGTTLDDFKKSIGAQLLKSWAGTVKNPAWRLETIYRTNCQMAYSAGRWSQMTDPAVATLRPFGMFDATLDNRVTERCSELDGTILPWDEIAQRNLCTPLHFNCRSNWRSMRKSRAEKMPKWGKAAPDVKPQQGFGLAPGAGEWKPDLTKYPPALRVEVEGRMTGAPTPEPMPLPKGIKLVPPPEEPKPVPAPKPPKAPAPELPKETPKPVPPPVKPVEPKPAKPEKPKPPPPAAKHFDVKVTGKTQKARIDEAIAEIDGVHETPESMGRLPVLTGRTATEEAQIIIGKNGNPLAITIRAQANQPGISILHEIGHFFDHQGHDNPGVFASETSNAFVPLLKTLHASRAYEELQNLEKAAIAKLRKRGASAAKIAKLQRELDYVKDPKEMWARAYAQYIAKKSGNKNLLAELDLARARGAGVYIPFQWDDDDFRMIEVAIDAYMKKQGWKK